MVREEDKKKVQEGEGKKRGGKGVRREGKLRGKEVRVRRMGGKSDGKKRRQEEKY